MPSPAEIYLVEISTTDSGMTLVAVTDRTNGRRLSGSTMSSTSQMVGVLIEDHRERAEAEPVDPSLSEQKRRHREAITAEALSAFGDETVARAWLSEPHRDFDNRRPLAVACRDEDGLAAVRSKLRMGMKAAEVVAGPG